MMILEKAKQLARQCGYELIKIEDVLCLQNLNNSNKPFYIDFQSKKMQYRLQQASLRKEMLARCMGKTPRQQPAIIDATAGLGRDSMILAKLGYHVIMLEQSPILFVLLQNALQRASHSPQLSEITLRLTLIHANAITWLEKHSQPIDIIYLDPMFPTRDSSAAVKKEMVILQDLVGHEQDNELLLQTALRRARYRVVVKRPRLESSLNNKTPSFASIGKSSRFDVYQIS